MVQVSTLEDDGMTRCSWANGSEMMRAYHDEEWGVHLEGEQAMFERLSLEAFQAGLSWATILRKRPAFREAFRDFDLEYCAGLDDRDVEELMGNAGIIRARAKIEATRSNAAAAIDLREDGGLETLIEDPAATTIAHPTNIAFKGKQLYMTESETGHILVADMPYPGKPMFGPKMGS